MHTVLNLEAYDFAYGELIGSETYEIPYLNLDHIMFVSKETYKQLNKDDTKKEIIVYKAFMKNKDVMLTPKSFYKIIEECKKIHEKESFMIPQPIHFAI